MDRGVRRNQSRPAGSRALSQHAGISNPVPIASRQHKSSPAGWTRKTLSPCMHIPAKAPRLRLSSGSDGDVGRRPRSTELILGRSISDSALPRFAWERAGSYTLPAIVKGRRNTLNVTDPCQQLYGMCSEARLVRYGHDVVHAGRCSSREWPSGTVPVSGRLMPTVRALQGRGPERLLCPG